MPTVVAPGHGCPEEAGSTHTWGSGIVVVVAMVVVGAFVVVGAASVVVGASVVGAAVVGDWDTAVAAGEVVTVVRTASLSSDALHAATAIATRHTTAVVRTGRFWPVGGVRPMTRPLTRSVPAHRMAT